MEVHFTAEIEKKLNDLATQSDRPTHEPVQDAVAGMFSELAETREMLDRRYDEVESGNVRLIDGEEAFASCARQLTHTATARHERLRSPPEAFITIDEIAAYIGGFTKSLVRCTTWHSSSFDS